MATIAIGGYVLHAASECQCCIVQVLTSVGIV